MSNNDSSEADKIAAKEKKDAEELAAKQKRDSEKSHARTEKEEVTIPPLFEEIKQQTIAARARSYD